MYHDSEIAEIEAEKVFAALKMKQRAIASQKSFFSSLLPVAKSAQDGRVILGEAPATQSKPVTK